MSAAEKPILFCTTMVQATLEEIKTNTRRICNIPDGWEYDGYGLITSEHPKKGKWGAIIRKGVGTDFPEVDIVPAKYQVGDVLWVRETWCKAIMDKGTSQEKEIFLYRADEGREWTQPNDGFNIQWKPSIFMPKEACRIFLRVTNIKVERLQNISVGDIAREGLPKNFKTDYRFNDYKKWFKDLWNSINGKGAWEANPYVFVYKFKKITHESLS